MSSHRQQAHLDVPLESAWELVATPTLYPAWWPRVIEVDGQEFEEGDEFVQVIRDPTGKTSSSFLIERRDEMREIRMSCRLTGAFAHWTLTAAQDGTFVELEMGMQPQRLRYRLFDAAIGRSYFRKWSDESLAALRDAASARAL
ncbi:MAG TPA: SRPBCC family protein [Solirubrobacterales bacterium]|nr:SRPBCC family protein [Solirubrobacterales bacterium]